MKKTPRQKVTLTDGAKPSDCWGGSGKKLNVVAKGFPGADTD